MIIMVWSTNNRGHLGHYVHRPPGLDGLELKLIIFMDKFGGLPLNCNVSLSQVICKTFGFNKVTRLQNVSGYTFISKANIL